MGRRENKNSNREKEEISIEGFTRFYTHLINSEEKAQYVRKQRKITQTEMKSVQRVA